MWRSKEHRINAEIKKAIIQYESSVRLRSQSIRTLAEARRLAKQLGSLEWFEHEFFRRNLCKMEDDHIE